MRTFAALERGAASELLLTPGFIELQPAAASHAVELAQRSGVRTTLLSGVAALELDLVGDGVGARLRRPLLHTHDLSLSA